MNKESEALKELKHWKETNNENGTVWLPLFAVEDIEKSLKRLEAINNANPSEALNQIDFMILDCVTTPLQHEALKTVEQALLKAQENEKVIKAIKKHFNIKLDEETELNGNVWGRLVSIQAKEDNGTWDTTATANLVDYKEDFDLLREYFKYE